jgi:Na+/H+ antiporter
LTTGLEKYMIILFLLGMMIVLSAVAERNKLPSPIVLIFAGIGIGFIPEMTTLEIDPKIIFLLFLPPLLYDAAFNISIQDFKEHLSTISSLAFGLVFITTITIAVFSYFLIPGMTWALSFVLGAILAATDAVAAMSMTKDLGLSRKTAIILEGESLINDASALVAYRFAVAAVTGTAFLWWKASVTFISLLTGGFIVGLVMGKLSSYLLRFIRGQVLAVLSLILLLPFVTYLLAEELHFSGVIAVVVLGFYLSRLSSEKFPELIKIQSKTIWEMITFLLNGLIFILIGLQFPAIVGRIPHALLLSYTLYAFAIAFIALLVRMLRILLKRKSLQLAYQDPRLKNSKRAVTDSLLLSFRDSVIIGWSGMRGVVSLAVAIGLPRTLASGAPFPMRDPVIFISTLVVLVTIVGQGILLPFIVKDVESLGESHKH